MNYSIEYGLRDYGTVSHFGRNLVEVSISHGRLYLTFEEDNGERFTNEIWLNTIKNFNIVGEKED